MIIGAFIDWTGPVGLAAFTSALVALLGHAIVWRQRGKEMKHNRSVLESTLRMHQEKLEADAKTQWANLENAWALHSARIEAEICKDDVSRKMQLRRELLIDGHLAIGKAVMWIQSLSDLSSEPDFKNPVLQDFALALGKLIFIGNERTVAATYQLLDRWRNLMHSAVDQRFGHDVRKLPFAQREFIDANVTLILALRSELGLEINEEWLRSAAINAFDEQMALSNAWLEQVHRRTQSEQ